MRAAARALVRLADAIDGCDWDGVADLLADDFVARLVHTGEELDREAFVALNRDYPGAWRFVHEDVVDGGDRAVLRARVSPADGSGGADDEVHHVASFGTVDESGLLSELVEVWGEESPAAPERRPTT